MRQWLLLTTVLVLLLTSGLTAAPIVINEDMVVIDIFTTVVPASGDGAVNSLLGDATDRSAADDDSILQPGTGFRDRELEATNNTLISPARGGVGTVNVGPGNFTGTVHSDTTLALTWDGIASDSFSLDANGAFDFRAKTAGLEQHSLFIDGEDGSGNNVTFDVTARSAAATVTLSGFTFGDDTSSVTQVEFRDFNTGGLTPTFVDFSSLHGLSILFHGSTTTGEAFTLHSVYAHNPEPASLALMSGLAICGFVARRRRK